MARELTALPRTAFSGLDYDNIISDVINLVKDNPDYNVNWDDFLSSDAGRMLTEIFSYIADQLATRIDWVVNENYLSTATQKRSVMRLLKIIGYNFTLPIAATVSVDITTTGFPGEYYLTEYYDASAGTIVPFSIQATNTLGQATTFELISYDSSLEKYDYKIGVTVDANSRSLPFYEGKTYVENFSVDTNNGQVFTVSTGPVIEKSARIYFVNDDDTETELLLVTSFLDPEAQTNESDSGDTYQIPYIIEVNEDETISVEFGSTAVLPNSTRRLAEGDNIKIFYRVGGGIKGNISSQIISTTKTLSVEVKASGGDTIVKTTLLNQLGGTGGTDGETADHAATYAPLQIRTADKAVSAEDYDTLLNAHSDILTAKVYGNSNIPDTIFASYRKYMNPFDVWVYATPNTGNWTNYNPSQYNDVEWISLSEQNMFNNIHNFRKGDFNNGDSHDYSEIEGKSSVGDTIDPYGLGGDSFKNYVVLDLPTDLTDYFFGNEDVKIKVTTIGDSLQTYNDLSNVLIGELKLTTGDTTLTVSGDTYASFKSYINIDAGVDLTTKNTIKMGLDEVGDTEIDLSLGAITVTSVKPFEIAAAINKHFALTTGYGSTYGDSVTGTTGIATVVQPDSATSYLKITSPLTGDSSQVKLCESTVTLGGASATDYIFGDSFIGDTYYCYGVQSLTFITNAAETNYYKKIIFQNGSLTFDTNPQDLYVHYIRTAGDTIALGSYFYDNYAITDPQYRTKANRIYNTVEFGDTGDSVDIYNSNFEIRFTEDPTTEISIYNIDNDWDVLPAARPKAMSSSAIIDTDGDTMITLDTNSYNLNIEIDQLGDTTFDITGDLGVAAEYQLSDVIAIINVELQAAFGATGSPYDTYSYAKLGDTYPLRIVIESPTFTSDSSIIIGVPANNAAGELKIDLSGEGNSSTYYPSGDYYLEYNITSDSMDLKKVSPTKLGIWTPPTSSMPDSNFYIHFIWDRRNTAGLGEDTYQTYLNNSKVIAIENVFKQTKFSTFYIVGSIYYEDSYSKAVVKYNLENALKEEFSFRNSDNIIKRDYYQSVSKSDVIKVAAAIDGVSYIELSYFGKDSSDTATNEVSTIFCDFFEILILHESGLSFTYYPTDEQ